jgi:hypothetical protein
LIVICRISVLINIFSARVKLELDLRYVDWLKFKVLRKWRSKGDANFQFYPRRSLYY